MGKRAQLHGLVRNLRQYLEWQAVPLSAGLPAPDEERESWERQNRERQQAQLHRTLAPEAEPPAARPTFSAPPAAPAAPARATAPAKSAAPLWKDEEIGARPRKTFEPSAPAPTKPAAKAPTAPGAQPAAPPPTKPATQPPITAAPAESPRQAPASRAPETLAAIRTELGDCKRCTLCESRSNIVFGVGNPNARLMFVGEAPGFNEDKKGMPFVGKAGELLDKMIVAMTLSRDEVYIANVLKCRPPENRDPTPDEIAMCSPFLERQVAAIQPDVIVALGKFAANLLSGNDGPLSRVRGAWQEWQGVPLMPTYHPAYLLRNPAEKAQAWDDLKKVMERLNLEIPQKYR